MTHNDLRYEFGPYQLNPGILTRDGEESFSAALSSPTVVDRDSCLATAADLLLRLGTLVGSVAGTTQVGHGHKQAKAFLNGSITLFCTAWTRRGDGVVKDGWAGMKESKFRQAKTPVGQVSRNI